MNLPKRTTESGKRRVERYQHVPISHLQLRPRASRLAPHLGISLIEVLVSLFVMLFGLMGVAALFPVGNFYAQKGEKFDLGATLAIAALDELQTRGMLRPERWLYASDPPGNEGVKPSDPNPPYPPNNPLVIQDFNGSNLGFFNVLDSNVHPGRAYVIDPLASANGSSIGTNNLYVFPYFDTRNAAVNTDMPAPWLTSNGGTFPEERWPVRRLTVQAVDTANTYAFNFMPALVAETVFTLRDDLVSEQPEEDDHPAIQRWEVNDQGTPTKNDDTLLARQFQGNYTWLASIVPTSNAALSGLQPSDPGYGQYDYDVSVVVFRKRDITPSAESERLVDARMLPGGEIEMFIEGNKIAANLDPAFKEIRSGGWIAVMGVHQTTGVFLMKWYRMLALDRESSAGTVWVNGSKQDVSLRRAMLAGPDWPMQSVNKQFQATNLKVALLPGAISVVTKPMKMESDSLWGSTSQGGNNSGTSY